MFKGSHPLTKQMNSWESFKGWLAGPSISIYGLTSRLINFVGIGLTVDALLGQEMLQNLSWCLALALVYFSHAAIRIKLSADIGSLQWTDDGDGWWREGPNSSGLTDWVQTEKMQLTRSAQNKAHHSNCPLLHHCCCNAIHRLQFQNMKNHHERRHKSFQFLNSEKVLN